MKTESYLFWRWLWCVVPVLMAALTSHAQNPGRTNLRIRQIAVEKPSLKIDSLSIIPGTFSIDNISDSLYSVDYVNGRLHWIREPVEDSIWVRYRVFPIKLNAVTRRMEFDSVMGKFSVTPFTMRRTAESGSLVDFGNVNYNGSFGRGLAFGNRQDVVVNSTLNLQINGYLGDSIQLAAAITDNNIPIQPDGNTQNLNEFDQVYVQFSKDKWRLSVGDIDIRQGRDYFLNFYKRLQGVSFETENRISRNMTNKVLASGAVAKGKFTRNIFQGLEGNQGPYRLKGANNELFFIVLAGTERVFIDGILLQRGEDQDYVINYNTAEVTFTPRQMITKDKRIQIEFEYADRNYLNSQIYLSDQLQVNQKLRLRLGVFSNNDAKNSSINQTLDANQKQFLADIGDSVNRAFYPSAVIDTFANGKILYEKVDTSFGAFRDSIFVYSTNSARTLYNLSFSDVGAGRGNYILDLGSPANGKVYRWVAPDSITGQRLGQYEPAILLIAPRKQQMFTFGGDYMLTSRTQLTAEMAMSRFDVNTFSSKDKGNDQGLAGRLLLTDSRPLHDARSTELKSTLYYEHVQSSFRALERLRNVEFNRDWGLPFDADPADENLFNAILGLKNKAGHAADISLSGYLRSDQYNGLRTSLLHRGEWEGWRFNNQFNYTWISQPDQQGYFARPVVDLQKVLKNWKQYQVGFNYSLEHNELAYRQFDSLNLNSFSFDVLQLYLKSAESRPNKWGLTYFTRSDKHPFGSRLLRTDRSQNVNLFTELMSNPHHQLRFNGTFRKLNVTDSKLTTLKSDATILGRAEYFSNFWKGAANGNVLYELGTGQEPRRDFSYIEVPAGQGQYTWIDYNNDGIQQLNEFELARFPDQARYIQVFTPTTDFVKANYLQFNYSFVLNPASAIDRSKSNGLTRILTAFYLQSALQISRKSISNGPAEFNPFGNSFDDSSLLTLDQLLSNTVSYNRSSTVWGVDVNNIRSSGRAFLSYGYETRRLNDWSIRARYNFVKRYTLDLISRRQINELLTPQFSNRNFQIEGHSLEPRITYTLKTVFRAQAGYKWEAKKNLAGGETSRNSSIQTEMKYNVLSNTSLTGRFTFSQIEYEGAVNTTVSYIMLDGLQPGENFLWTLDLTKRLTSFLELNMQYEGRKAGTSGIVHVGRAQLRALF